MPVHIYLSKANAPQEYETIDESELRDDDVVVEHIHEDAKTEEKENENGEKEVVEVSPAKDKVKIRKFMYLPVRYVDSSDDIMRELEPVT